MLFSFLQYVSPTWYFNLTPASGLSIFSIDFSKLSEAEKQLIELDDGYRTTAGKYRDMAYQAVQKGFIIPPSDAAMPAELPNCYDNYRFLRKYYHPLWSYYVLILRLLTFHNPIVELYAWFSNRKVRRLNLYDQVYPHETRYSLFTSELVGSRPKVSVIIPTLNRYPYLADVLLDLEKQDYPNFDVIVVDQSEPFQSDFYTSFQLNLQVIHQSEKALWLARNTAIKTSDAEYLLLFDDDSRVEPDWISQHLKTLDYFQADISSGVSISLVGAKVPTNYSFFRWGDQVDTGNVLIHRRIFERVGLFDRQFEKQRMGDGEFGLRAYLAGFKNISNPYAKRLHLKVGEGGLRQMGSWDAFRPKNWWSPRPIPSVLYYYRKYFPKEWVVWAIIIGVLPSIIPYRFKRSKGLMVIGSLLSLLLLPLIAWQVWRSWQLSSAKLKEGPKIDTL